MLRYMGAIEDSAPVVTSGRHNTCPGSYFPCSLHDFKIADDMLVEKWLVCDVLVDIICATTDFIFTNTTIPQHQGVYLDILSPEKLA
ncbi:hypothetical protein SADUNF_Sadunf02G0054800 [Salix dunnii]|uniref:Uncharacterized protein n=1 Tax=Salix dunnii TaxID=1413687 RepID=A0A835TIP9_9ROSI|nr:hypothetical protein SADUNF_Sadunf02G0054800 [Salix dunnii]